MRDIPMFTTEYGVAALGLSQVRQGKAYIKLHCVLDGLLLLEECVSFCTAAGAEKIYATGDPFLETFPLYSTILEMRRPIEGIGQTQAMLFPVQEHTFEKWRTIYNEKMKTIPNAATFTAFDRQKVLSMGAYFVHKEGMLVGIGIAQGDRIEALASLSPGAGTDVVIALSNALSGDTVILEVAEQNEKAMRLYSKMGFVPTKELSRWYVVK